MPPWWFNRFLCWKYHQLDTWHTRSQLQKWIISHKSSVMPTAPWVHLDIQLSERRVRNLKGRGYIDTSRAAPVARQVKKIHLQSRRHGRWELSPCVRKIPWRRKWQPTPVFLPGESHGQQSLSDYSPKHPKESDMTEWLRMRVYSI